MTTIRHPLLRSSVAKLRWAETHADTLQHNLLGAGLDPVNRAPMYADLNPETGYHDFKIKAMPSYAVFTRNAALGVGDVIGAARAALDHAVWHIVENHVGVGNVKKPRSIGFPLRDSLTDLDDDSSAKAVRPQVPTGCWDVIVAAQPYNAYPGAGGVEQREAWSRWGPEFPHPLGLLRDLSNDDKHRLVTTVVLMATGWSMPEDVFTLYPKRADDFGNIGRFPEFSIEGMIADYGKPMALHQKVVSLRLIDAAEPHIEDAGDCPPTVALPNLALVLNETQRITSMVEFVLSEFQRVLPTP